MNLKNLASMAKGENRSINQQVSSGTQEVFNGGNVQVQKQVPVHTEEQRQATGYNYPEEQRQQVNYNYPEEKRQQVNYNYTEDSRYNNMNQSAVVGAQEVIERNPNYAYVEDRRTSPVAPKEAIIYDYKPKAIQPDGINFFIDSLQRLVNSNGQLVDPMTGQLLQDNRLVYQPSNSQTSFINSKIKTLSTHKDYTEEELKEYVINRLGIDPNFGLEVYQPKMINVEPIELQIKDPNGRIGQKLEAIEKETGLSVIPFKLAGLNKFVIQIMGYDIYDDSEGNKYATGTSHIANKMRINDLEKSFSSKLCSGEIVEESVMMDHVDIATGEKYRVPSLNRQEMDYILTRFREFGVLGYSTNDETYITMGI